MFSRSNRRQRRHVDRDSSLRVLVGIENHVGCKKKVFSSCSPYSSRSRRNNKPRSPTSLALCKPTGMRFSLLSGCGNGSNNGRRRSNIKHGTITVVGAVISPATTMTTPTTTSPSKQRQGSSIAKNNRQEHDGTEQQQQNKRGSIHNLVTRHASSSREQTKHHQTKHRSSALSLVQFPSKYDPEITLETYAFLLSLNDISFNTIGMEKLLQAAKPPRQYQMKHHQTEENTTNSSSNSTTTHEGHTSCMDNVSAAATTDRQKQQRHDAVARALVYGGPKRGSIEERLRFCFLAYLCDGDYAEYYDPFRQAKNKKKNDDNNNNNDKKDSENLQKNNSNSNNDDKATRSSIPNKNNPTTQEQEQQQHHHHRRRRRHRREGAGEGTDDDSTTSRCSSSEHQLESPDDVFDYTLDDEEGKEEEEGKEDNGDDKKKDFNENEECNEEAKDDNRGDENDDDDDNKNNDGEEDDDQSYDCEYPKGANWGVLHLMALKVIVRALEQILSTKMPSSSTTAAPLSSVKPLPSCNENYPSSFGGTTEKQNDEQNDNNKTTATATPCSTHCYRHESRIDFRKDAFWPSIVETLRSNVEMIHSNSVTGYSLKCLRLLYALEPEVMKGILQHCFLPYLLHLVEYGREQRVPRIQGEALRLLKKVQ